MEGIEFELKFGEFVSTSSSASIPHGFVLSADNS